MQKRLADVLDTHLQTTQYGCRHQKSTAQAVHYVTRVKVKRRKDTNKNSICLTRLGKALDKIKHKELMKALRSVNGPEKM